PSLASLLGAESVPIEASLLGLDRGTQPSPTFISATDAGGIDLISAAPTAENCEMDYAAMLLRVTTDPDLLLRFVTSLRTWSGIGKYDYVFFDHRTGLSTSVLPVLSAWPGSVVISTRRDGLAL